MNRQQSLEHLQRAPVWDLLVVGGGATGLGVALEAAQRGWRVALLESHDFASGTSSRSTKLLHGGVRYLAQGNLALVREALAERQAVLKIAPHLAQPLPFVMPCYQPWQAPFYGVGLKLYDWLAGRAGLGPTRWLGREQTQAALPGVQALGLRGGIQYWDAQFEDARLALAVARSAEAAGALLLNCVQLQRIEADADAGADVQGGRLLQVQALARPVAAGEAAPAIAAAADRVLHQPPFLALDDRSLLKAQDYTRSLKRSVYEDELERWQGKLALLSRDARMQKRALALVFEGMDAAGKGSTIRRVTQALDARFYRVVPVAAPNENERAQPYLWRFWRYIPALGRAVIFDRSWYGRVLVERVEGLCAPADWLRAYGEINEYEEELSDAGVVIVKFWLAITPEEQLRRFREREQTLYKNFKITPDDWRNREKWPQYERAVEEMIDRTSTQVAPWHIVASDNKHWSRIEVLRHLCQRLEAALERVA